MNFNFTPENEFKEKVRRIKNNAIKKLIKYSKKKDFVIEDFIEA